MNAEFKKVRLVDITKKNNCSASEDGDKVHAFLVDQFRAGESLTISFEGAEDITSAFLNASFGRLYNGDFDDSLIRERLKVADATPDDLYILKRVVERAKQFYRDPQLFVDAAQEVSDEL